MTPTALWCGGVVSALSDWPDGALGSAHVNEYRQLEVNMKSGMLSYQEWLSQHSPIIGAEDDDDVVTGDPADDVDDDDLDNDDDPASRGGGSGGGSDDDDDDEPSGREQLAEAQRQIAAANQAARKAKQEARAERERIARESGDWENVAKEARAEADDLKERVATAEERANVAEYNLDQFERRVRVVSVASRFGFQDPADAMALLKDEDTENDKSVERALRKLAEQKPYLVNPKKASGAPMGGGGGGGGLTIERIKSMSPQEIINNKDAVDAVMARAGRNGGG